MNHLQKTLLSLSSAAVLTAGLLGTAMADEVTVSASEQDDETEEEDDLDEDMIEFADDLSDDVENIVTEGLDD